MRFKSSNFFIHINPPTRDGTKKATNLCTCLLMIGFQSLVRTILAEDFPSYVLSDPIQIGFGRSVLVTPVSDVQPGHGLPDQLHVPNPGPAWRRRQLQHVHRELAVVKADCRALVMVKVDSLLEGETEMSNKNPFDRQLIDLAYLCR